MPWAVEYMVTDVSCVSIYTRRATRGCTYAFARRGTAHRMDDAMIPSFARHSIMNQPNTSITRSQLRAAPCGDERGARGQRGGGLLKDGLA